MDTVCQKVLYNSCSYSLKTHVFTSCNSENKTTYSTQVRLHCVLLKKIVSV